MEKYISEDYCSKELTGLLQDKGYIGSIHTYLDKAGFKCKDITLQSAMKWLREEKDILIEMHHLYRKEWYAIVSSEYRLGISVKTTDSYSSYEEACENAIKYVLENLI